MKMYVWEERQFVNTNYTALLLSFCSSMPSQIDLKVKEWVGEPDFKSTRAVSASQYHTSPLPAYSPLSSQTFKR